MNEPRYKLPYDYRTITRGLEPLEDAMLDFNERYEIAVAPKKAPMPLPNDRLKAVVDWIKEEVDELELAAYGKQVLVDQIDALVAIAYHAIRAITETGIEPGPMFEEVHRSNMSKLGLDGRPIYREDGKVAKGPSYEPPDITGMIDAQTDYYNLPRHPNDDCWDEGETLF